MTSRTARDLAISPTVVREVVELACLAPSVHNTQPWAWQARGNVIELHADQTRQLCAADPDRRDLTVSCGAALHHAQVAGRALGWMAEVERFPEGQRSTLLATLTLSRATPSTDAREQLLAIRARCTDRRRFTSWPVPPGRLHHLAEVAAAQGAEAVPTLDVTGRMRAELIVARALDRQRDDQRLSAEQLLWIDHSVGDGVPAGAIPASEPEAVSRRARYGTGLLDEPARELESTDGLLIMRGPSDDPAAWLRTGEGLSALWLEATMQGMSVVPLSQAIELEETREALRVEVLRGLGFPHLLVRVGWQAISRSALPSTPRRPLDDVLTFGAGSR